MTLERADVSNHVKMTECPFCGRNLPDGIGFPNHKERCPKL